MTRLLVCGSRSWTDRERVFATLDQLHEKMGITFLMEGCADGADRFAEEWAALNGVTDWHFRWLHRPGTWPRSEVYRINSRMLADGEPEYVVAFDKGSKGTADMVAKARNWGLTVLVVREAECVQCGARVRPGDGHRWPTGAVSCGPCFNADFGQ